MNESQKYNADALELETQLRLAHFIKDYLTNPTKETDLIPANTGIGDMNIENQISLYNNTKLKRDRLIDDSSENNPVVQELNNSLRAMKQNIIRAVDKYDCKPERETQRCPKPRDEGTEPRNVYSA